MSGPSRANTKSMKARSFGVGRHGRRYPELLCGGSKSAEPGGPHECPHADKVVHSVILLWSLANDVQFIEWHYGVTLRPEMAKICPAFADMTIEWALGGVMSRPGLDLPTRQLVSLPVA